MVLSVKREGIKLVIPGIITLLLTTSLFAQSPVRTVENNRLTSSALPAITLKVNADFEYVGKFDFRIRDVAAGERFVFVDAAEGKVNRLFIAQFEGFLPNVDEIYRYSFENALVIGSHRFRQNPYAYSNRESRTNNPGGEGALTEDFLKTKGLTLEDELMMSRFVTVAGEKKKHELILFYIENISQTNHTLKEFYENDKPTQIWHEISAKLKKRSMRSFLVK